MSRQVESDIGVWVKRFTVTFKLYICRSRPSVINRASRNCVTNGVMWKMDLSSLKVILPI